MKKTKILAIIAALAVTAAMLTACSSSTDNADATVSEATTAAASEETTAADTEAATESETEAEATEATEAESEATESETEASEEATPAANALQPLVDAAMSVGEWPGLMEQTDEMMIADYYQFDLSKYDGSIIMFNPMSANMTEIIIFKSADVDTAKADLEARRELAINQHAFYPDDVIRAEASIVGAEGEYAYFIMSDFAEDAEKALIDAIKAL